MWASSGNPLYPVSHKSCQTETLFTGYLEISVGISYNYKIEFTCIKLKSKVVTMICILELLFKGLDSIWGKTFKLYTREEQNLVSYRLYFTILNLQKKPHRTKTKKNLDCPWLIHPCPPENNGFLLILLSRINTLNVERKTIRCDACTVWLDPPLD